MNSRKKIIENIKWCTNCLAMSTRPRISFDSQGKCGACRWSEEKKKIDWQIREKKLESIFKIQKAKKKAFDCLVPVSGGKDGSYVSYMVKEKYGMKPLCVTVKPALSSKLGEENLKNFIDSGYQHISISPSVSGMQKLNKNGLIEMGSPYFGWLTAIHTAVLIAAVQFDIDLIIYGEDGELEYGGSTDTWEQPFYDQNYQKKIYLEGGHSNMIEKANLSDYEKYFYTYHSNNQNSPKIKLTHWSHFENWDPYRNYLIAKKHCGLKENDSTNSGTFTNFGQTDQYLYPLHAYLMYLKFGFGRANQDASIEIRRGAMDREQAKNLVELYDGSYPEEYVDMYLDYYKMSKNQFDNVIDKWANKDILIKKNGYWKPDFEII